MKMRYCFLISVVPSIIVGVVLSYFIEIWASVFVSLFSCYWIGLIIYIKSIEAYKSKNPKFKGLIPTILSGLLELYSLAFALTYKGEKTIIFGIVVTVLFAIGLLVQGLIILRQIPENKDEGDTK